jgi:hypothetical protein
MNGCLVVHWPLIGVANMATKETFELVAEKVSITQSSYHIHLSVVFVCPFHHSSRLSFIAPSSALHFDQRHAP